MIVSMKILSIVCLLMIILVSTPVFAQIDADSITNPESSIEIQPDFPKPGESITATLNDYSSDTYGSAITWVLNGKELVNFKNQRQATLVANPTGEQQTLEIILSKADGGKRVVSKVIKPIYLDIIIEPQTRVPDFYLGRSLPSIGSIVNATALVSGNGLKSTDLVYTWRINREVIEGGPIRGRNQVSFTTPFGEDSVLSIQVTEPNGTIIASRAILLPIVSPEVKFYEVNSLFGIKNIPISSILSLTGNSVVVRAEPYNLDSRVYNDPNIHEWKINDINSINTAGGNPYEVTLQKNNSVGTSNLQFHVRDMKQLLQGAKASVEINF